MTTQADPNFGRARILVAAPPKSGSSYVGRVMRSYFGIPEALTFPRQIDFDAAHNLSLWMIMAVRGQPFCFNFHMLPHVSNLEIAAQERIMIVGQWRNLGDMLVSLDDHILADQSPGAQVFILDLDRFKRLAPDARMTFLIDTIVPWYLNFYLRWRNVNLTLHPYEQMLLDRRDYFRGLIAPLLSHPPLEERLDEALGGEPRPMDRFNVGRRGRSAEQICAANKRRLEDRILMHPDIDQLEILLWELPWDVPALAPAGPLDGQVVRTAADDTPYFVSRRHAYPIARPTWLLGRVGERRTPRIVTDAELAEVPRGTALL